MPTRAPSLTSLAARLEAEAKRVQSTLRVPELELASDLLMCAQTLRRLARSGPALVRAVAASGGAPAIFAETRALLDLLAFLATAEMALHSAADAQLRRSGRPVGRDTTPWRTYIKACDIGTVRTPVLSELRRLDLRLVEARNRLLAHRLRGHALAVTTWRRSRRVQISLRPASVDAAADAELRAIATGIGAPATGSPLEVVAAVLAEAEALDGTSRKRVAELLKEVGYESQDPSLIVADLLRVTAQIT